MDKVGAFLVSGNYNNTGKAGVFYTNINNTPDTTNVNISFRAAFATLASHTFGLRKQVHPVQILVNSTGYKKDTPS